MGPIISPLKSEISIVVKNPVAEKAGEKKGETIMVHKSFLKD